MRAWEWLKEQIAAEFGAERAEALWAEYRRRSALDLLETKRRDHQERLARAQAAHARGARWAAQAIEKHQRWLEEH